MNEADKMIVNAIEHWKDAKGVGTALIPAPLNDKSMVLGVLQRVYSRSPTCKTIIITTTFADRGYLIDYLTHQPDSDENNEEFKKLLNDGNIKLLTSNFIEDRKPNMFPHLCILYRPDRICAEIVSLMNRSKFILVVLNKLLDKAEDMTTLYKISPILDDFKQAEIDSIRTSSPVEEIRISVDIPADSKDAKLLEQYNEYVSTSIAIFGSFDIMQQANTGNQALNISSMQICLQIAQENGWNEHLDMSLEFNREIDRLYNPSNLKERASKTYEIVRLRNNLVSDYEGKLEHILKIVEDNHDKKILIINKRGEFANKVTDYINTLSDKNICMNYHDKVNAMPMLGDDGNPVVYKSGAKRGQHRMMGAQAQKTYAESLFNANKIRVLSTNNAPDKDLNIEVDIVIITSSFCENIRSYMYRLSNVYFKENKVILYSIYCRGTNEQKQIESQTIGNNHNVKNSNDDDIISDFIVAD